jgi:murein DD-endopeptidase MepM/ murein hydrolase activator NlpD
MQPEAIDLGNDPPLSVDGGVGGVVDRRRVSVQWFSGTILTGVCGAALMGGAVFTALDGETNFATMPERIESPLRGSLTGAGERPLTRKGDRLPPMSESSAARQIIRVSTESRVGDREVMRARQFVRISANLSLIPTELTANLPPFNAQKLLAAAGAEGNIAADDAPRATSDAEVSFVIRDLAELLPKARLAATLATDEIIAGVRKLTSLNAGLQTRIVESNLAGALAYAPEGDASPGATFRGRIFPENITLLPKTSNQVTGGNPWSDRAVIVKKGESISSILRELGATPDEIKTIAAALGPRGREGGLKEGQRLRILLAPAATPPRLLPIRVIVFGDSAVDAIVALSDKGKYVTPDVQSMNTEAAETAEIDDGPGIRLYQSIFETALRHQMPRHAVESLIRIYSYDVDFYYRTQPGDSFDVLYTGDDETAAGEGKTDVLFASLNVGGETKKFYRFLSPDDGTVDYYDETGKSVKKFLVRKPLETGVMRSPFGDRNHPILGVMKSHTGVDWAAPLGTPIYAAGNGTIDKVGWESGYGKYIKIRHANGYETAYGHMTAFARGIDPGTRVRQGQVIGYVGSTGLSTGPHLHYEIIVNGYWVDPMRLKLPRGRVLEGPVLASFEQERERIDRMMTRAGSRVAQTIQSQ